jgi:hypothetical protein
MVISNAHCAIERTTCSTADIDKSKTELVNTINNIEACLLLLDMVSAPSEAMNLAEDYAMGK